MLKTRRASICFVFVAFASPSLWPQQPAIFEYSTPGNLSSPGAITVGPDGNLWFTDPGANAIGKITPTGAISTYPLTTGNSAPYGITTGPDGNLWFAEEFNNTVAKITTAGAITEYGLPTASVFPTSIVTGKDGNLWFLENQASSVGKITPDGIVTEYRIPPGLLAFPSEIILGPDGNLWFGESPGYIGQVTTAGAIQLYPALANTAANILSSIGISEIATGSDGAVWFTDTGRIWRMTTAGTTTLVYAIPTRNSLPNAMTTAPDGALWITENGVNQIARVTLGGLIVEYSLPLDIAAPAGIVAGPDGNIWFTALGKICKLVPPTVPAVVPAIVNPTALTFNQTVLSTPPPSQTLSVTPSASGTVAASTSVVYSIGSPWLTVSPSGSLTGAQTLTVTVNGSAYGSYGAYFGDISIAAGGVTQEIPVTMNVVKPTSPPTTGDISVSPASLAFTSLTGTAPPAAQQIALTGASNGLIPVIVSIAYGSSPGAGWLSIANTQGTVLLNGSPVATPAQLKATVNPSGLEPGTYTATVSLSPAGGSVVSLPVTLTVSRNSTTITLTPSALSFVSQAGGSSTAPSPQSVTISVSGTSNAAFRIQELGGQSWLQASPSSGTAPGSVTISVNTGALAAGVYTDSISVSLPQSNPVVSAMIAVTLTVAGTPSLLTQFKTPSAAGSLTPGPDGAMWFTEPATGRIGRITTSGSVTEFPLPTVNPAPGAITLGPDGNLWFAEQGTPARIAKIATTGAVTEFALPFSNSDPAGITSGPDGNIWFTEYNANKVGKITLGGTVTEYSLPGLAQPIGITKGPDGNVWFTESGIHKIAKITPNGSITGYDVPSITLRGLVTGPDGNVWFPEWDRGAVGKMTPTGSLTEYLANPVLNGIVVGSDGNLWTGDLSWLVAVRPDGGTTELSLAPAATGIMNFASGTDGNLWFTDTQGIGRYTLKGNTPAIASVTNAASFQSGGIAPGEIITITGTNLGPAVPLGLSLGSDGKVSTSLGGVAVTIGGFYAPLLYLSATQINCIVPYETASSSGSLEVEVIAPGTSSSFLVALAKTTPGVFTANGSGNAAILNSTGGYNSPQNPAPQGSTITLYLTGEGQTIPAGITGTVTSVNTSGTGPLTPQPVLPISVTIGGAPAPISFFGEAPGMVAGVLQMNAQIPTGIASGNSPLVVTIGGVASQGSVTVAVK